MKQECTQWLDEGRLVFNYLRAVVLLEYWSRVEKLEDQNARFAQIYKK